MMIMMSLTSCFITLNLIIYVFGSEEVIFQHAPSSLVFTPGKEVLSNQVEDIISVIYGFSTKDTPAWDGIHITNPFKRPEAVLIVELNGFSSVYSTFNGKTFTFKPDLQPFRPYQSLADSIFLHFPEQRPFLMEADSKNVNNLHYQYSYLLSRLPSSDEELVDQLSGPQSTLAGSNLVHLNMTVTDDLQFLKELQLLTDISQQVSGQCSKVRDGVPDLYWIYVSEFNDLVSKYGPQAPQVHEALTLLKSTLKKVQGNFADCYGEQFVQAVITTSYDDVPKSRNVRQAPTPAPPAGSGRNLGPVYSRNYSAIFNIFLFTMLVFSLSVFGIALGIWNMDPGRDSVIYRISNQRMKRD